MLLRLEIDNFALIEHIEIDFIDGFTVITGETGAGKSILIDAIGSLLGLRTGKDIVRRGCEKAQITAVFEINPDDKNFIEYCTDDEHETIVVSREILSSGKTFSKINSKLVPLSVLKEITSSLLDIHGQHENQKIFSRETQLEMLDKFSGDEIKNELLTYKKYVSDYRECMKQMENYIYDDEKKEQMIELLKYQNNEIKKAKPKEGEEENLIKRKKFIDNSSKIRSALENSYELLNGESGIPALAAISETSILINKDLNGFDEYEEIRRKIENIEYELEDICNELKNRIDSVETYPEEENEIQERLDILFRLKRKYGGSIESVIEQYRNNSKKLEEIMESEELISRLKKKQEDIILKITLSAKKIYDLRKTNALELEEKISSELAQLGMKNTRFHVKIVHESFDKFKNTGMDTVEFLISPNPGEELKPLAKIASGGEASRIMLAIKTILARSDSIDSLIFDEVDTGISGKTAVLLGKKLNELSRMHQVFCVTHMAAIAARAKTHFCIEKKITKNTTVTEIRKAEGEDRINEIARLLSGEENKGKATDLAKEMLNQGVN